MRALTMPCMRTQTDRAYLQTPHRRAAKLIVLSRVATAGSTPKLKSAEKSILQALQGVKGRGKDGVTPEVVQVVEEAVALLEADGGVKVRSGMTGGARSVKSGTVAMYQLESQDPTASGLLDGRWRLVFNSRPGTASPIQRGFTGVDSFTVYQEIQLEEEQQARVNNIVDFGDVGVLKVMAEANTDSRPLPGFMPRRGAGLPIFGKSMTYPPQKPNMRIDFAFDNAYFDLSFLPIRIPYPVPFKLLGDETKGWIDVTYLSPDGRFRLSRGNKGTLFILVKDEPPRAQLLDALDRGAEGEIPELLESLVEAPGANAVAAPARAALAQGKWQLRWSQQASDANPLQRALSGKVKNFQIIGGEAGDGRLDNLVEFSSFFKLRASAACEPSSDDRTAVNIDSVQLEVGSLRIPLQIGQGQGREGYVDWLYLDDNLRVTRGNKGSVFVHTRAQD